MKPNKYKIPLNFIDMSLNRSTNEEKFEFVLNIILDMYNNKQIVPSTYIDMIIEKAIDLKIPNRINDLLLHHQTFHYYPNPTILISLLNYYIENSDYDGFVVFYKCIGNKYYLLKTSEFYNRAIKFCIDVNDKALSVMIFCDILDYSEVELTHFRNIIYLNKNILKDSIFIDFIQEYVNYHKDQLSLGYLFINFVYYLSNNNDTYKAYINLINDYLASNKDKLSSNDIQYNKSIKLFLRSIAGDERISLIDKSILESFDEKMKFNIFDEAEKTITEPDNKEDDLKVPTKSKVEEEAASKKSIKQKKVSYTLDIKKNPFSKATPFAPEDLILAGHKPGEKKVAKKQSKDDDDEDDGKAKKGGKAKK